MESSKKIILFEDEPFLAEMWSKKMEQAGYVVVWKENPSVDPVAIVKSEQPDLILMSVIMPVMDGFEATKRLKADKATVAIPIVGLSNLSQAEEIEKAMELGMEQYLVSAENTPAEIILFLKRFFEQRGIIAQLIHDLNAKILLEERKESATDDKVEFHAFDIKNSTVYVELRVPYDKKATDDMLSAIKKTVRKLLPLELKRHKVELIRKR